MNVNLHRFVLLKGGNEMVETKKAIIGDWVQIKQVGLTPEGRAPQVPEDTRRTPLLLWTKGIAETEAEIGSEIKIRTITGRVVLGELVDINPRYSHDFGNFVPELLKIDMQLKDIMSRGGEK